MVDDVDCVRNFQAPWDDFESEMYRFDNYAEFQPEDQEILAQVSRFFTTAFADRPRAKCSIDVGSGSNLYPALLSLPWTDRILLTDFSERNVRWLHDHVLADHVLADGNDPWPWQSFWQQLNTLPGYNQIGEPRKHLREACASVPGLAGVERRNVFDLPEARWELGTMFFVAESITEDAAEFRTAIRKFVRALVPGAPFAAAFMKGSDGYEVAGTKFPALRVTSDDVAGCFATTSATDLNVEVIRTPPRVRHGYEGMVVATGIVG